MLELYHSPISTCSQKVRLCLHEKQIDYVSHVINLHKDEHLQPNYLAINPNGVVPALVHDGRPIIDSSVIMEYLDEIFPEHSLMPSDAISRAHVRAWMRYIEEVPTVAIRYPSFNKVLVKTFDKMGAKDFSKAAARRPLRKHFYQQMSATGFEKSAVENSLERLRQTAERMEASLHNTDYVAAPRLTIADFAVIPTFDRMHDLGLDHIWTDLPRVTDWWAHMQSKPAFSKAYFPGSRLSDIYSWDDETEQPSN